jgi:hypothetical protein
VSQVLREVMRALWHMNGIKKSGAWNEVGDNSHHVKGISSHAPVTVLI